MNTPQEYAAARLTDPDAFEEGFQRHREMSAELGREIEDTDASRALYRETMEEMAAGDLKVELFQATGEDIPLRDEMNLDGAYNPYCPLRRAYRLGGIRGFFGVLMARYH